MLLTIPYFIDLEKAILMSKGKNKNDVLTNVFTQAKTSSPVRVSVDFSDHLNRKHNWLENVKSEIRSDGEKHISHGRIKLSPVQRRILRGIYKLLRDKSENKDQESLLYLKGNPQSVPQHLIPVLGEPKHAEAILTLSPSELYEACYGKDYSGGHTRMIKKGLHSLNEQQFYVNFTHIVKVNEGGEIKRKQYEVAGFENLIVFKTATQSLISNEKCIREKTLWVITLHPILTNLIEETYILEPDDYNQRLMHAVGGNLNNVTTAMEALIDHLAAAASRIPHNNPIYEMDEENLYDCLYLTELIKQRQKRRAEKLLKDAIEIGIKVGLILKVEKTIGKRGQNKYIFRLNKNWHGVSLSDEMLSLS